MMPSATSVWGLESYFMRLDGSAADSCETVCSCVQSLYTHYPHIVTH